MPAPRATRLRSDKHSQKVTKRGVVSDKKVRNSACKGKFQRDAVAAALSRERDAGRHGAAAALA